MDRVSLQGIRLWGFHGILPREKESGQPFEIDIDLYHSVAGAAARDCIDAAVNYASVYDLVRSIFYERTFELIEALAETLAGEILTSFPVERVAVRVRKPRVPLEGPVGYAEVEIERERQ